MLKTLLSSLLVVLALTGCIKKQPPMVIVTAHDRLMTRLDTTREHGIMYGHQDDPFYGISWQWEKGRSDTRELVGDYPAVMGFDLGGLELGDTCNLDSVPFHWIRQEVIEHHKRGGIITFSWHPRNPRTGGNAWDVSDSTTVRNILPGGEQHELFLKWMSRVANFLKTIQTKDGRNIPYILRPWHEYNGSWFWWGQNNCTEEQFLQLWCMFQDYMKEHLPANPIWSFSPNLQGNWTEEAFLRRYPGNDRVDLLGCDAYQWGTEKDFQVGLKNDLDFLCDFAEKNKLLFAMTECGKQNSTTPDWWSRVFLPLLEPHKVCYVLPWRNWHAEHFGASKDAPTAEDFRQLVNDHRLLLLNDILLKEDYGRDSSEIIWL